jgi:hypothetical protein
LTTTTIFCYNQKTMKNKTFKKAQILVVIFSFVFIPFYVFADGNSPTNLTATAKNQAVFLQWINQVDGINHLVEYKPSTSSTWTTYNHAPSTAQGIVVHNLSNQTSYDFRVSTITSSYTTEPSQVVSSSPSSVTQNTVNNHIISTGQSNSIGAENYPISTTQPYNNRMLNASKTAFVGLIEPIAGTYGGLGETMSSGLANSLSYFTNQNYSSIISLSGAGAMTYANLMQGTVFYNSLIESVASAKNLSLLEGKNHVVRALTVIHGETDEYTPTPASVYEQNLVEWQNNYSNDIRAITGQEEEVILFTDQMNGHQNLGSPVPHIALAQYNAAKNNPGKIILVTPKYIFPVVDWLGHLTNYSQRRLGEYYAKVYKKVIIEGQQWKPLMPEQVTLNGNTIYARFHVPVPPLAFDTNAVMLQQNYGFEYFDNSYSAYITNVEIVSADTVAITLNTIPTGENKRLRYAYTGTVGNWSTGPFATGSSRGNLRDSDMTPSVHQDSYVPSFMGNYLRNWALAFDESITVNPTNPNVITEATPLVGPAPETKPTITKKPENKSKAITTIIEQGAKQPKK